MTLLVFRTVQFPQVSFDCIVNNVPNDLLYGTYQAYSLEHQKCHIFAPFATRFFGSSTCRYDYQRQNFNITLM